MNIYGLNRVLEPKFVLPTSAWKLDNGRNIEPDEMRVSIKRIHLEGTSFKQICAESNNNEDKIKQNIIDIVIRRGKLHNPVTDTGGLVMGVIDEIGPEYANPKNLKVGDLVICNASSASLPLHIDEITGLNYAYNQIEVKGHVIIYERINMVKIEEGVEPNLLMYILDLSGTLYKLDSMIKHQREFLVVGNNILTNLIFGYVIRRKLKSNCQITCLLDQKTEIQVGGGRVDEFLKKVFDQIHFRDILKPVECITGLGMEENYDFSINCAEIPGAETVNILATKEEGTVLFANLINNLNIALYITESISRTLNVFSCEGYVKGYEVFDLEIVHEINGYFQGLQIERVREEAGEDSYSRALIESSMSEDFIFKSRAMGRVLEEIMKVAKYDCNVIVFGETGVGKEKVANLIQKNSDRKMQPFLKINCGAISPNLIESEFFGYEKGAFTGANINGKKGYFEVANNGVLFLDEIGELPLEMQAKLLRVIQDGEFYRVGGTKPVKTNVRIVSATNRELEQLVEEGRFRRDLYYRLNVVAIKIPSLRDRGEDVRPLSLHFLNKYSDKFKIERGITEAALEYLEKQKWYGNIRELENTIQRLMITAKGDDISLADVVNEITAEENSGSNMNRETDFDDEDKSVAGELNLQYVVNEYEKNLIKYALEKYGSTRKAAKAIGISQTQLVRKKNKYQINITEP